MFVGELMTSTEGCTARLFGAVARAARARGTWMCIALICISAIIFYVSDQMKAVYVKDGSEIELYYTLSSEPQQVLDNRGIATMVYDVVDFSGFEGKMGVINIKRAFPVTVKYDGTVRTLMTAEITVSELLNQLGIKLGADDKINISPALYLSPNDCVEIQRVDVKTITVEEDIPYEVEYKENCLIPLGSTRTLENGKNGKRLLTYVERTVDGVACARELVDDVVIREPVTKIVLKGTNDPVSSLDFNIQLDANGNPVNYKSVLRNQICTGYSAGEGAYGASYMNLYDGYVAVRANEIPYGTRLYIKSSDGSFVYGCAIAADTGTGLMANVIDFDLFYETYVESCLNGRKYLDVYILN